ncbi:MAG: hypothetical protein ACFE9D_07675 [Promethearchaeota archaeon]
MNNPAAITSKPGLIMIGLIMIEIGVRDPNKDITIPSPYTIHIAPVYTKSTSRNESYANHISQ